MREIKREREREGERGREIKRERGEKENPRLLPIVMQRGCGPVGIYITVPL